MLDEIDTLAGAVVDAVPAAPPVGAIHDRLAARRRRGARRIAAVGLVALGGLALAAALAKGPSEPATTVAAEGRDGQAEAVEAPPPRGPDDINAQETIEYNVGEEVVGTVTRAELDAATDRVWERGAEIVGDAPVDEAAAGAVVEALTVIEAAPVRDEAGIVVGYAGPSFIPVEQYAAAVDQANAVVESYRP